MGSYSGYLHELPGKVEKLISSNQVEISFRWNKMQKTGTLLKSNLYIDCDVIANSKSISDYLHVGSKVKFVCTNPASSSDSTPLFIVKAWRMEENDIGYRHFGFPCALRPGLKNAYVVVSEVSKKTAVLLFKNEDGEEESVFMLASKFYMGKRRVNTCLTQIMRENDNFLCDAVPVIPSTNEKGCSWFACCVWRGNKPPMGYEKPKKIQSALTSSEEMNEIAHNPNNLFLFGEGQIMDILNFENGLLLGEIRPKVFQTILFHRSVCYMSGSNFSNVDLTNTFFEKDRMRFIAVKAPSRMVVQWIAAYVTPIDFADNRDFQEHGVKV